MSLLSRSILAAVGLTLVACSGGQGNATTNDNNEVRSITNAEALADFDQLANAFRGLYGAMERKQARYGFDFETMVGEYRARVAAAKTEAAYKGIYQEFVSRFEDAHVSLSGRLDADASQSLYLPFDVMPVEDTYVVYGVSKGYTDVAAGEELLAIDGVSTQDLYQQLAKYQGIPNPLAKKHFVASNFTYRPSYMAEGIDPAAPVKLTLRGPDGAVREQTTAWKTIPHLQPIAAPVAATIPQAGQSGPETSMGTSIEAQRVVHAELNAQGDRVPFFMTDQVTQALGILDEVKPSPTTLNKYTISTADAAAIDYYAVKYFTNGKKILLVRIPDYSPSNATTAINYLKALFEDQQEKVDGLILDEGHNPGGNISFATALVSLLAKEQANGYVQRMHADRLWLGSYAYWAKYDSRADYRPVFAGYAADINDAYDNGRTLSGPIPFFKKTSTIAPDAAHWTKPVLVLQDSLSVSCADIVPLLVKTNKIGQTFGETTMGGGGSVETVATLVNTQQALSISRGVGTVFDPTGAYPEETVIEDNGVSPTIPYTHTLADYRAGYVGYVSAFNKALTDQLKAAPAAGQ